uniref:Insertion element IS150 protein InsJ-like helix-turn-helix domain-containing protein n=1 Tax=Scylla olivacea TaxID=85551 RepID=A0A0P4WAP5_SCYOL
MCGCRSFRPTEGHERAGFVWLWASGMPVRDIAVRSGTSVTTVYRWIRRWQREGHVNTRPRSGRPPVSTTPTHNLPPLTNSSPASCVPVPVLLLTQDAALPRMQSVVYPPPAPLYAPPVSECFLS